jgi:hypothetical protein
VDDFSWRFVLGECPQFRLTIVGTFPPECKAPTEEGTISVGIGLVFDGERPITEGILTPK